jgi:ADP-ribose pyrophosphatase YjhB (NUDIX family)
MIRRKDSINYIEFLRGKYKLHDEKYILGLLEGCSVTEREQLVTMTFDDLWTKLWFSGSYKKPQTERMIKEYHKSKHMFELLDLANLCTKCTKSYETPEWELPKGRRSHKESNMKCAVREFEEETDLSSDEYILLKNVQPISEEYIGCNGVRYKHVYYYGMYTGTRTLRINMDNYDQYSEIGDIQFSTIEGCLTKIREEHSTKLDIIHKVQRFMDHWSEDFFLQ